uniref:DDE Tnp4 domain-containing protein n=1 Tax=Ditylenchus dipsaci TaxID=166011 RepID=A0A915DH47_9BILA
MIDDNETVQIDLRNYTPVREKKPKMSAWRRSCSCYSMVNSTFNSDSDQPEERLMLTLRFLATGEAFRSLSFQFRLDYLQVPATEEEWIDIAAKFFSRWNCPNTLGAIDGKHVLIKDRLILVVCTTTTKGRLAQYFLLFVMLTTGVSMLATQLKLLLPGIFDRGDFKKAIENGSLHLPTDSSFPFTNGSSLPFFFVGDGAFPLSRRMMKPFPGQRLSHHKQIYNYRISRARRLIENFFGILACSYRCCSSR